MDVRHRARQRDNSISENALQIETVTQDRQEIDLREIPAHDLDSIIDQYLMQGFRIDMVVPSDAPREVLLSKGPQLVMLKSKDRQRSSNVDWTVGRAGMMYRNMMPGRMSGRMAVSHIRLTEGGPVPDYVHYHKIGFQMIRCIAGRIKVVYEDQGDPFWLEPGDWIIQPPEIRHRVLECEAGSEVIEISMPAEHETWADHEMTLPTAEYRPERAFNGQRFVRFIAAK
jgi:quercetin dioxygenase-like cupin family protein